MLFAAAAYADIFGGANQPDVDGVVVGGDVPTTTRSHARRLAVVIAKEAFRPHLDPQTTTPTLGHSRCANGKLPSDLPSDTGPIAELRPIAVVDKQPLARASRGNAFTSCYICPALAPSAAGDDPFQVYTLQAALITSTTPFTQARQPGQEQRVLRRLYARWQIPQRWPRPTAPTSTAPCPRKAARLSSCRVTTSVRRW